MELSCGVAGRNGGGGGSTIGGNSSGSGGGGSGQTTAAPASLASSSSSSSSSAAAATGLLMDGDSPCGEDYECLPTNASLYTHMTAGAVAGILEHTVMYPVDSVKVGRGTSGLRGESSCVNFNAGFTNSFHRVLEVAVRVLSKGNSLHISHWATRHGA
ncbi:hypothetical protein E2320_006945 [Naja naja]|nr:hypothetical protein E2320_006945 [Naja naja]